MVAATLRLRIIRRINMIHNTSVKEKKHRLPIEFYQGKISVTFTLCTKGDFSFLDNRELLEICIDILEKSSSFYGCIVPVYCFMPDHLHFVLSGVKDDANLWKVVVQFKQKNRILSEESMLSIPVAKGFL